jgi:HD-GYP domain-containing protein (c-di-GMP phosphodiesterase class II)
MVRLTLQHPVRTLDDQLLFPSGNLLTKERLETLIHSQTAYSYQTYPLLSYNSVKEDCLNFLSDPPYDRIFSDKKEINDILKISETVHLSIPVLQTLDYFKKYDFHTYAHILMVFALSTLLAKDLIPDYKECIRLFATGPTHDIGKICVPLHILKKTTPLTKTERSFIEHHTVAGYVLLSYYQKDIQPLACEVGLNHHERRDCSGYPRGIELRDPLVEIVVVSDVYDALVKPRPYRSRPFDNRTALEEITTMVEQKKIGWEVVKALIAHNRKSKPDFREITISAEKRGTPPSYNVHGITAEEEKVDPLVGNYENPNLNPR